MIELESRGWSQDGAYLQGRGPHTGGRFDRPGLVGGGRRGTVTV
jgi:hypothetical protein